MKSVFSTLWALMLLEFLMAGQPAYGQTTGDDGRTAGVNSQSILRDDKASTVRFASFNVSFHRKKEGQLKTKLATAKGLNFSRVAEIIQRVDPDVILLNEFDYDEKGEGIASFQSKFLAVTQNGQSPVTFEHVYFSPVNTGVDSGADLDGDGQLGGLADRFGYGLFPGQYAMVVLSKFPIEFDQVRTFRKFLWKDMPGAVLPTDPQTGEAFYSDAAMDVFRLSSKSHWDVPVRIGDQVIHLLASHPTPPAFDGDEDRNGKRNHDEIRLFADYISDQCDYLYDDNGVGGGLAAGSHFVIAGDQNADPNDGDSFNSAANLLVEHPLVNASFTPRSTGGAEHAKDQGGVNASHAGSPLEDTADFGDHKVGNLRIDYCLPSKSLTVVDSGVFWPGINQPGADLVKASDHRLVWIDIEK
jgi:3-phytase/alkaline phosphatase D